MWPVTLTANIIYLNYALVCIILALQSTEKTSHSLTKKQKEKCQQEIIKLSVLPVKNKERIEQLKQSLGQTRVLRNVSVSNTSLHPESVGGA